MTIISIEIDYCHVSAAKHKRVSPSCQHACFIHVDNHMTAAWLLPDRNLSRAEDEAEDFGDKVQGKAKKYANKAEDEADRFGDEAEGSARSAGRDADRYSGKAEREAKSVGRDAEKLGDKAERKAKDAGDDVKSFLKEVHYLMMFLISKLCVC